MAPHLVMVIVMVIPNYLETKQDMSLLHMKR